MKLSKYFKINLDIGHFTAANYDAVAYLREHHANITNLHLKDRKKNQGDNVPWGHGRHADPRGAAAAEAGEVADSRLHRIRVPWHGRPGRRSEQVLRIRQAGTCMTTAQPSPRGFGAASRTGRIGMGLVGPGFVGAHHIDAVRRLGFVDVVAVAAAPRSRRAARPTRSACRRRTAATKRSPPIPTCTSCTTRRRTTCTCRSSWRRSRTQARDFRQAAGDECG